MYAISVLRNPARIAAQARHGTAIRCLRRSFRWSGLAEPWGYRTAPEKINILVDCSFFTLDLETAVRGMR